MIDATEHVILRALVNNETYTRTVLPYVENDYFTTSVGRTAFQLASQYFSKYGECATREAISVAIESVTGFSDEEFRDLSQLCDGLFQEEGERTPSLDFLIEETEKWCQKRALHIALLESVKIADNQVKDKDWGAIPELLTDALAVSFDSHIGHDYLADYNERYDFYHNKEDRIPFGLEYFDKITKGGLPNKTLNVALAGTGVGKSLFMCSMASTVLMQGRNVLYITLEMAEERIAERIDANKLNVPIQDLTDLPRDVFCNRVTALQEQTNGKLFIKEYPTASAHAGHFDALLKELQLKKDFTPDIVFIDYLNICTSQRYRAGSNVNSYTVVKAISEELRGLAVKHNIPIVSATQTTRSGYQSTDVSLTDTSESFGLPATADLMFALISTEELESMGQILVKQLKNRYNDLATHRKFVVGVDRAKMRLYDVEQTAQDDILESEPAFKPQDDESKFKPKSFADFSF